MTDAAARGAVRVLMLVENDVVADTRVQKEAFALARAGLDVTVLGVAGGTERFEGRLGPCRLVRVPVGTEAAEAWAQRRGARRRIRRIPQRARRVSIRIRLPWRRARRVRIPAGARADTAFGAAQRAAWRAVDRAAGKTGWGTSWRTYLPEVRDFERAFGPVVDEIDPDVIHAHDVRTVGVAQGACEAARRRGRDVRWIYDAHEYVGGLSLYGRRTKRSVMAWASLEREFIRHADRVITVSPEIATELQRCYGLTRRPSVVLNIPAAATDRTDTRLDLRARLGLPAEVPLLVYSGKVTAARGVQTAVEALTLLPEAHLAVVSVPHTQTHAVRLLAEWAEELKVSDRTHLLDPVPPSEVVEFLSSASVGLIPLLHFGSHEMALTNKLFEYLHAHLPVVVSDCRAQKRFVEDFRVGRAFPAEDASALAAAVRAVLAEREAHVAAITPQLLEEYSWSRQERSLRDVYRDLLGRDALFSEDELLRREGGRRTSPLVEETP